MMTPPVTLIRRHRPRPSPSRLQALIIFAADRCWLADIDRFFALPLAIDTYWLFIEFADTLPWLLRHYARHAELLLRHYAAMPELLRLPWSQPLMATLPLFFRLLLPPLLWARAFRYCCFQRHWSPLIILRATLRLRCQLRRYALADWYYAIFRLRWSRWLIAFHFRLARYDAFIAYIASLILMLNIADAMPHTALIGTPAAAGYMPEGRLCHVTFRCHYDTD